jgi:hypothetical protein
MLFIDPDGDLKHVGKNLLRKTFADENSQAASIASTPHAETRERECV